MTFQSILEELLAATTASRTTLRMDLADMGFHVDKVAAEAVAPGVRPIGGDSSLDQRSLPTVRFLEERHRILVQGDCLMADPAPPPELIELYGVRAQMLGPLVRGQRVIGWISVHYTAGPREWSEEDVSALRDAIERVQQELLSIEGKGA